MMLGLRYVGAAVILSSSTASNAPFAAVEGEWVCWLGNGLALPHSCVTYG